MHAGIAASDAACSKALGKRSRAERHQEAAQLLAEIVPGGEEAAKDLGVLLGLKDRAQCGAPGLRGSDLKKIIRRAERLCEFAEVILRS